MGPGSGSSKPRPGHDCIFGGVNALFRRPFCLLVRRFLRRLLCRFDAQDGAFYLICRDVQQTVRALFHVADALMQINQQ